MGWNELNRIFDGGTVFAGKPMVPARNGGLAHAALQGGMRFLSSGRYDYELTGGLSYWLLVVAC